MGGLSADVLHRSSDDAITDTRTNLYPTYRRRSIKEVALVAMAQARDGRRSRIRRCILTTRQDESSTDRKEDGSQTSPTYVARQAHEIVFRALLASLTTEMILERAPWAVPSVA